MLEITRENLRLRKPCFHFLLVACLLLSAGCYRTDINPDGSGQLLRFILVPEGADPQTFCPKAGFGYTTGVNGRLCLATAPFKNLSELRELLEAVESPKVKINQLEKTESGKLIIDLSVEAPTWLAPYTPEEKYAWVLKMPGQITNHNATEAKGNELHWRTTRDNGMFRVHVESQVN